MPETSGLLSPVCTGRNCLRRFITGRHLCCSRCSKRNIDLSPFTSNLIALAISGKQWFSTPELHPSCQTAYPVG